MVVSDRLTGAAIAALGAVAALAGSRLPDVPGQQVGPGAFPLLVGGGLVLCGILVAFRIGHDFESEAELVPGGEIAAGPAKPWSGLRDGLKALLPIALLVFYYLAVDRLGFVPTAAAIILVLSLAFGARLRLALPVACLGPIVIHLAFYKLLRVPLPAGLLPMPW